MKPNKWTIIGGLLGLANLAVMFFQGIVADKQTQELVHDEVEKELKKRNL